MPLGTILLIILILLVLGALPTWPYSGERGYYPSGWPRTGARRRPCSRADGQTVEAPLRGEHKTFSVKRLEG
jgi:Protein of unknown function (DUF3309)